MLNFCSLYSGSSGNSMFVESENTKLLIDVGMSCKKIEEALLSIDKNISSIDGILITHEHSDHIKGLSIISKKYNIPIYTTQKTFDAMSKTFFSENCHFFSVNDTFYIKDLKIKSFSIPHDAVDPCGFNICSQNHKLSIATDIGHMTKDILNNLEGSELILLESNYDAEVLKCCKYPFNLKARIAGSNGHLSNTIAGKTISYLLKNSNLHTAILGHLSKESNFPELAYQTTVDELITNGCDTNLINLSVANRDLPGKLVTL